MVVVLVIAMNLLQTIYTTTEPETYVLHGCTSADGGSTFALSLSNYAIRLYDAITTTFLYELREHTQTITDMTTSPAQPSLLFSSQEDGGILITDLRQAKPAHFIVDACNTGIICSSLSLSPSGTSLVVPKTCDLDVYDTRKWSPYHRIEAMHWDDISRVRYVGEKIICSAGEDLMVNFIHVDPATAEDDILLHAAPCGEVMTKMSWEAERGLLTMVGSCENGYVHAYGKMEQQQEEEEERSRKAKQQHDDENNTNRNSTDMDMTSGVGGIGEAPPFKYERPNFFTYLVDWCVVGGQLVLVSGERNEDGDAGGLSVQIFDDTSSVSVCRDRGNEEHQVLNDVRRSGSNGGAGALTEEEEEKKKQCSAHMEVIASSPSSSCRWRVKESFPLTRVHHQITRIALALQGNKMITGGEDGVVAFWEMPSSSEGWRGSHNRNGGGNSEGGAPPHHHYGFGALSCRPRGGEKLKGRVSVFSPSPSSSLSNNTTASTTSCTSSNHQNYPTREGRLRYRGGNCVGGSEGSGRGCGNAPYRKRQ